MGWRDDDRGMRELGESNYKKQHFYIIMRDVYRCKTSMIRRWGKGREKERRGWGGGYYFMTHLENILQMCSISDNSLLSMDEIWNLYFLVGPSKIRINAGCTDRFFLTNVQERSTKLNLSPKVTSHSQFQMLPMDRPDNWDAFNWSWSLDYTHPCVLHNIADVTTLTPELYHSSPVLELSTCTVSRFQRNLVATWQVVRSQPVHYHVSRRGNNKVEKGKAGIDSRL